jgi:D-alanyl-D-alanine carboxypeptidase
MATKGMRLAVLRARVTTGCSMVGDGRVGKSKSVHRSRLSVAGAAIVAALTLPIPAAAQDDGSARARRAAAALVAAYPDFLASAEGNDLVWTDSTHMTLDDGKGAKPFEVLLDVPDLKDMFYAPYPRGAAGLPPAHNSDPGRVRFQALFDKMYGDCTRGEVERNLVDVVWLPRKGAQRLKATRVNGVAGKLQAVSDELDRLPDGFTRYLVPSAGTYNCRVVAGTRRVSAHGHGIAIDIASGPADHWLWNKPGADGRYRYKNRVPMEIVAIFEKYGFIWGGRWYHYDTMHFEYRPEILAAAR